VRGGDIESAGYVRPVATLARRRARAMIRIDGRGLEALPMRLGALGSGRASGATAYLLVCRASDSYASSRDRGFAL